MIALAEVLKRIDDIRRIVYALRSGMPSAKEGGQRDVEIENPK